MFGVLLPELHALLGMLEGLLVNLNHEANRRHWNRQAAKWEQLRDNDGLWRRIPKEPALAGLGMGVTSLDISEDQLAIAARRAERLGLTIELIRADATEMSSLLGRGFDLVCSTNGFYVWIADLPQLFKEIARILAIALR